MRNTKTILSVGMVLLMLVINPARAQLENPFKKLKSKAEDRVNSNVDKGIDKTFDAMENEISEGVSGDSESAPGDESSGVESTNSNSDPGGASSAPASSKSPSPSDDALRLYSKYDFVPGDTVIFEDLLEQEQNGEFPSKWDLKAGNVEIALFGGESVINFPSTRRADIVPLMKEKGDYLPEKFTIEFDAYFSEFCTRYTINLYDLVNQKNTENLPEITISPQDIFIMGKGQTDIKRDENYPYWQRMAISFNIRSLKIYLGEQRIANIPNLGANPTGLTIASSQCHDGQGAFIRNIRIAKGSMNLYERVVTDGKFVTNGIRFDIGKATLKPESMGVINEIHKLMSEHPDLNFSVEGHTDSDGDDSANQQLSEARAATVKTALVEKGIDSGRLSTKGYGESQPIDNNSTQEGKANNRRVEFIKM